MLNLISISEEYNETKEMIVEAIKLGKILEENAKTQEEREQTKIFIDVLKETLFQLKSEIKQKLERLKKNISEEN